MRALRSLLLALALLAPAIAWSQQSGPILHVPGPRGPSGPKGDAGLQGPTGLAGPAGVNAYTAVATGFTMPAVSSTVSVSVASTAWMVAGQTLYVGTAGYMSVSSITSGTVVVLQNIGATGNAGSGTSIPLGAAISPAGASGVGGGGNLSNSGSPSAGQIGIFATPTTIAGATVSGDCTQSSGAFTCTKTSGVSFAASATTDTTNATNLSSGTIASTRLPVPTTTAIGGVKRNVGGGSTFVNGIDVDGSLLFGTPSGAGTVTSASVVSANGFAGSVATATTTPAITLSTTVTGLLKGNGTAVSAATAGTDYLAPGGALGTPSSGTLTNATGLPCSGLTGLGAGGCTFLITPTSANLRALVTDEVGSGALYFVGGALGTPASATLTNATGLPCSGIASLASGACTFLATATSANLAALLTDETGTGANVFATGPTLLAPIADRYLVSTSNTNAQSGTTYTVTSSDCGKNVILTNAAAITVSVNTGLTAACWVTFTQGGAGQITVAGSATVNSANGKKTRSQYSVINVMYGGATDTYILSGDSST